MCHIFSIPTGKRRARYLITLARSARAKSLPKQPLQSFLQELALRVLARRRRSGRGRRLVLAEDLLQPLPDGSRQRPREEFDVRLELHLRQRAGETERDRDLPLVV